MNTQKLQNMKKEYIAPDLKVIKVNLYKLIALSDKDNIKMIFDEDADVDDIFR